MPSISTISTSPTSSTTQSTPRCAGVDIEPLTRLFFFAVAAFSLGWGVWALIREGYRLYRVNSWPTVPGTVTCTALEKGRDEDWTIYTAIARYEYHVDGVPYTGVEQIGRGRPPQGQYAKRLDFYQQHPDVPVAYNPLNPEQSLIADSRRQRMRLSPLVEAMFTMAFSLIMTLAALGIVG
jgi:hypothetical protein